jgi:predicted PurR-regulated permease PerM
METSLKKAALPFDSRTPAITRTAIAILVVALAAWVARDFLVALTWAAVIAITAWPIYIRFAAPLFGGRSLAPLLFTLLTGLVLPVVLAVHQIAQGSDAFVRSINQLQDSGIPVPGWLEQLPIAGRYLDLW